MVGKPCIDRKIFPFLSLRARTERKRTIIFGLKSDSCSREMLLRFLDAVVKPGDSVLAIHVQEPFDTFDPNTFHFHEDLCKSKEVDFLVKVCVGNSYISELGHQVRINYATILALGCSLSWPDESVVNICLKGLPPTCSLLVIDNAGRIILQKQGTSQDGSACLVLRSCPSSSDKSYFNQQPTACQLRKSLTVPSSSMPSSIRQMDRRYSVNNKVQAPNFLAKNRLLALEAEGFIRHFTLQELNLATNYFSSEMVIGEDPESTVYKAILDDGRPAAVEIIRFRHSSADDLLQEVELLSRIKHENVVQIIGFCESKEVLVIVYSMLRESLKRKLRQLKWNDRIGVAIGVARALEYLHHCLVPPVIHRNLKLSNIFLSEHFQPQLSDFGAAMELHQSEQVSGNIKPINVVGGFGHLAPEYIRYGKVDQKADVYSYGVLLLELITGKEAVQTNHTKHESLVLWARSLLSSGLCERLIDPCLNGDYKKEEMEIMMFAARLCLIHSSSRRPTMKMILRLFEDPEHWLKMRRERDELLNGISSKGETYMWKQENSAAKSSPPAHDLHDEKLLPEAELRLNGTMA